MRGTRRGGSVLAGDVMCFSLCCLFLASVAAGGTEYRIDAVLYPSARRLEGSSVFNVVNRTEEPQDRFYLVAYPNHYAAYGEEIRDRIFDRVFPSGVSLAAMSIRSIEAGGEHCRWVAAGETPLARDVLLEVYLPVPLAPGERIGVTVAFEVDIPERFGSFGAFAGGICLNGGWYPFLPAQREDGTWEALAPPPSARFALRLEVREAGHVLVNGRYVRLRGPGTVWEEDFEARYLGLFYHPRAHVYRHVAGGVVFHYFTPRCREREARHMARMLDQAMAPLEARGFRAQCDELWLVEAPLRRDLALPGERMVLLSDRFRQTAVFARDYHHWAAAEALYRVLFEPVMARRDASAFPWEAEAAAWLGARDFQALYSRRSDTVETYLRPFGFLPAIDRLLHAPRFPFVGALFGDFYETDPLGEDILRYNRTTAHGRIIAEKLRDLLGDEKLRQCVNEALRGEETLPALAEKEWGRPLDDFLAQWTHPYPVLNYELLAWEQSRRSDGTFLSEVALRRRGDRVEEPVTVEVKRLFGPAYREQWSGEGCEGVVAIATPSRMHRVRIDPDHRLRETTRRDNQAPPRVRVLLDDFRVHIDLNGRDHEFRAGGSVIIGNDYRNEYRFRVFTDQEKDGVEGTYVRSFGRAFDAMDYRHSLSVGFAYAGLDPSYADAESGYVNPTGRIAALKGGYTVRTSEPSRNQLDGWRAGFGWEVGDKVAGAGFRYYKTDLHAAKVWPLVRDSHLLALRGRLGAADRTGTPTQLLFDIGGFDGIRGINRGRVLGCYRWQATMEYRYIMFKEINAHAFGTAWLRALQWAAYVDAGGVSNSPGLLFHEKNARLGAGLGLRLHADLLGLFPGVWRFDAARQLDESPPGRRWMFYIGAGQSF